MSSRVRYMPPRTQQSTYQHHHKYLTKDMSFPQIISEAHKNRHKTRTFTPCSHDQCNEVPEALAAVTTPFFLKTGGSLAMPAGVTSGLGCSSTVSSTIPFFVFMGIGTISSVNLSDGTVLLKCFKVSNKRNYQKVESRWIITLNIETRR